MYKISCCMDCGKEIACVVEFDDNTACRLTTQRWFRVVQEGLKACGYTDKQHIVSIMLAQSYIHS